MPAMVKYKTPVGEMEAKELASSSRYEWKITNFNDILQSAKVQDYIKSPNISLMHGQNALSCSINLYPKGLADDCEDYVSLTVRYKGDYPIVIDAMRLSMLNDKNEIICEQKIMNRTLRKGRMQQFRKFVNQNFLLDARNCALVGDTLVLQLYTSFDSASVLQLPINPNSNPGNNKEEFESFLDDEKFSDVKFIIGDKTINAHKFILTSRGQVFRAMFEHQMIENQLGKVEVTDVKYEIMKELLRFIYARKVNEMGKIAEDLLIAADKYSLDDLKAQCEQSLYGSLNSDNAVRYLILTNYCNTVQLKSQVIQYINDHPDIVDKTEFKALPSDIMYEVVRAATRKRVKH